MQKRWILILLTMVFFLLGSSTAWAMDIRVLLGNESYSQEVKINRGDYTLYDGSFGLEKKVLSAGDSLKFSYNGGLIAFSINNETQMTASGYVKLAANDADSLFDYKNHKYRGDFSIYPQNNGLLPINILNLESYLYGVVGKEIGYNLPMEALKAQAVASRSFAVASLNRSKAYDVSNTTASQVYGGYDGELVSGGENIIKAVDATAGEIITYQQQPIKAYFHANSGGYTEDIINIWGSSAFPLKGVPSPRDSYAKEYGSKTGQTSLISSYQWQVQYSQEELINLVKKYNKQDLGNFKDLILYKNTKNGGKTVSGRNSKVEIIGTKGRLTVEGDDKIRSLLQVKSSLFSVSFAGGSGQSTQGLKNPLWLRDMGNSLYKSSFPQKLQMIGADGLVKGINENSNDFYVITAKGTEKIVKPADSGSSSGNIIIDGKGFGHGVGMSQWGAIGMAVDGKDYHEILRHYYFCDNAFAFENIS